MESLRSVRAVALKLGGVVLLAAAAGAQTTVILDWGATGGQGIPPLPAGVSYVQLSSGTTFSAARRSDGQVVAWGDNTSGECNVPPLPPGLTYTKVSAGGGYFPFDVPPMIQHAAAVRSDGQIIAWGDNRWGQCDVAALPPGLTYIDVAAGGDYTTGLRSDGTLIAWGRNIYGQCNVPALPPGRHYVEVVSEMWHTLARRDDGAVLAWGNCGWGACDVPALPPGVTFTQLAACQYGSFGLCSNGELLGWGENVEGEMDIPPLPAGLRYLNVGAGFRHGLALRSDGTLVTWGTNFWGNCNVPALPQGYSYLMAEGGWTYSVALVSAPTIAPAVYCSAKTNSLGCTPAIGFAGALSVSGPDDFVVTASGFHNQRLGTLFWGRGAGAIPFYGGTLCISGPLVRAGMVNSGGSATGDDCTGSFALPITHAYLSERSLGIGDEFYFQAWSRDAGAAPFQVSLSDALHVVVNP